VLQLVAQEVLLLKVLVAREMRDRYGEATACVGFGLHAAALADYCGGCARG
jgi:hypothetical protein